MVRSRNDHGVYVPIVQETTEVLVPTRAFIRDLVNGLLGFGHRSCINVTDSQDERVFGSGKCSGKLIAPTISAENSHVDSTVGAEYVFADSRHSNGYTCPGKGCGFDEFSSGRHVSFSF
jgi:hypothetical protein